MTDREMLEFELQRIDRRRAELELVLSTLPPDYHQDLEDELRELWLARVEVTKQLTGLGFAELSCGIHHATGEGLELIPPNVPAHPKQRHPGLGGDVCQTLAALDRDRGRPAPAAGPDRRDRFDSTTDGRKSTPPRQLESEAHLAPLFGAAADTFFWLERPPGRAP